MKRYNPKEIEPRWQQKWTETGIYEAEERSDKPKKYILEYFPYPSGAAMHVGHVRNYTIGDAVSRYYRMQGFNVLHPMGWDAFGLPAENFAIKTGISPQKAIADNTARFKQQLTQMGFGYDWSREINSSDPAYYKWTQWFFLLLHRRGLTYRKESLQWWCPVDKTVLANEQVEAGKCWRCGSEVEKKALPQWFFKITDYADRLSKDLDDVDWSDGIKNMQRNWIGRSVGAEITFKCGDAKDISLNVFTTRPDTLYGATFLVVAPEHPIVQMITTDEQREAVTAYQKAAQAKSDVERQETNREKTGVFTGEYAVNPVTNERIPIWVADYVLYGYGTGAIMAVPAHDERDFDFAKKYKLKIIPVMTPFNYDYLPDATDRPSVNIVAHDPKTGRYCILRWHTVHKGVSAPGGGIDEGETLEQAAAREFSEETGYDPADFTIDEIVPAAVSAYYTDNYFPKQRSVRAIALATVHNADSLKKDAGHDEYEKGNYTVEWLPKDEVLRQTAGQWRQIFAFAFEKGIHVGEGVMINSGPYDNMRSEDVREKLVADLAKRGVARERVNYKIRDWLISRQRYWGAPIPMIHCEKDGIVPVPEDQLPVVLPEMQSYEPSGDGRSPLARVEDWVNVECPQCGGPAQRETDTMDGFACSSWYFLRFADPHNNDAAFSPEKAKYWLPVDDYIGGAEHAVMHLLYARMWTKVMQDAGLIEFGEPFKTLRNQGMILAPDGAKMSKSKGNTIEPDSLIEQGYGADAIRIMELFIGPWSQAVNWSVEGMGGSFRFLQRVWQLVQWHLESDAALSGDGDKEAEIVLKRTMHAAAKKVTDDFAQMSFNTAIAALMESVNELYKAKQAGKAGRPAWSEALETFILLLAPFAPHMSEELWHQLGHEDSIHIQPWPKYDETYLVRGTMTIVVQVNGKVRAQLELSIDATEQDIIAAARTDEKVSANLQGNEPKKTIYVPKKLVSFVI